MLNFNTEQQSLADAAHKMAAWLFDVTTIGGGDALYFEPEPISFSFQVFRSN